MLNYDTDYDYDDIPWDEIPNGNYLPASIVIAELEMLSDEIANSGKRMFVANFKIIEPEDFYGRKHTERYVVSTDEFPQKFDAMTIGAVSLKQMRMAAQIKPMKASELCEFIEIERPQLMFQLKEPKPEDDFQNNSIVKYFKIGEREPEILQNTIKKRGNKPQVQPAKQPKPPKRTVSQPQTQQYDQNRNGKPKQPASRHENKAPSTPQNEQYTRQPELQHQRTVEDPPQEDLVPFEVYENDDDISYDTPPKTNVATKHKTAQETAAKSNTSEVLITCPTCNESVPSSQMGQHMADHFRQ
jgi:hypothetical protein